MVALNQTAFGLACLCHTKTTMTQKLIKVTLLWNAGGLKFLEGDYAGVVFIFDVPGVCER
jgi:hypothetical protein